MSNHQSNIKLIFTIDKSYNIKAVLTSLPHIVYGFQVIHYKYPISVIRADFDRWHNGIYTVDPASDDNKLIIREEDRVYTFLPAGNLNNVEILWLFLDELTLLNGKLGEKLNDLKGAQPALQTSEVKQVAPQSTSQSAAHATLFNVDYRINMINIDLLGLNEFLSKHCSYVVGVRGYWIGNTHVTFNITQVLCLNSKPFEPFVNVKLVNKSTLPDENPFIVAHDLLKSFSNISLRLYCKESHIMTIDLNDFVSKSVNAFLEGSEADVRNELNRRFYETSDFVLERLEYRTSLILDTSNAKCFAQLNKLMQTRNMQIVEGSGHWLNPLLFVVTKLVFRALDVDGRIPDDDGFEKLENCSDQREQKNIAAPKPHLSLIKGIEKYYRKNPTTANQLILVSNSSSASNYNVHLLLTLEEPKPTESSPTVVHAVPEVSCDRPVC